MKVISDFNNEEGIDVLMNCADDIQAIITNENVSKALDEKNFLKIGAVAYKECKKNVKKVFSALGEEPASAVEITVGITQIILDVLSDQSFKDFFTFLKTKSGSTSLDSATESTEEEA